MHPLRWSIRLANLLHTIPLFNETYASLSRPFRRGVAKINNNWKTRIFQGSSRSMERVQSSRKMVIALSREKRGKSKVKVAMDISRKRYRPLLRPFFSLSCSHRDRKVENSGPSVRELRATEWNICFVEVCSVYTLELDVFRSLTNVE